MQLQNEWVTRSLTSIAPRYRTQPGECSVYSCLTQFTAPELLAGNNKWACGRCSKLRKGEKIARRESNKTLPCNDYGSDISTEDDPKSKTKQNDSHKDPTTTPQRPATKNKPNHQTHNRKQTPHHRGGEAPTSTQKRAKSSNTQ